MSHKLIFNIFKLIFIITFILKKNIRFEIAVLKWNVYLNIKVISVLVLYSN